MTYRLIIFLGLFFFSVVGHTEAMNSRFVHLYWGVGPNFGLKTNLRLGFSSVELGIIQETGPGIVWVQRTSSPVFLQLGVTATSGGGGLIGGGGFEWNTSSFFRFRTDITVCSDSALQTQSLVSFGGVLVL